MASSSTSTSMGQEYTIKVPKNVTKRYHVMRFNYNLDVDFSKWSHVKMERENNMREFKRVEDEQPKFGAGSEFGREAKEEARLKKLGIISRKYKADDQPWILKTCGSTTKKFKGIREGGVSENTAYYVFTHAADGVIEAFPLNEWYKFQPIQRYKTLTADEAEEEFSKRNKHLNYFSLMLRKRLKGDDDIDTDDIDEKGNKKTGNRGRKSKDLKISDMDDEWMNTSDDSDDSDADVNETEKDNDAKQKKKTQTSKMRQTKSKKRRDTSLEAGEESDDGDGEGRELDYISDSSDSEPENVNLESVAEEKALRKLLTSDEEGGSDSEKSDVEQKNPSDVEEDKEPQENSTEDDKVKKKKFVKKKEKNTSDSNSDFSSDSSTDEEISMKHKKKKLLKKEEPEPTTSIVEAATPIVTPSAPENQTNKRKLSSEPIITPKKPKLDVSGSSESGITEDAVRKYLMRKPMTTTELLQKFKSKKTGLSSEQLVNIMTQILKKINPVKQTLKGKMYLFIKS